MIIEIFLHFSVESSLSYFYLQKIKVLNIKKDLKFNNLFQIFRIQAQMEIPPPAARNEFLLKTRFPSSIGRSEITVKPSGAKTDSKKD
jgi:hypothetical protein